MTAKKLDIEGMQARAEAEQLIVLAKFRKLIDKKVESDTVKEWLNVYLNNARLYAIPKFLKQDLTKSQQRQCDLIGGIPYTSDSFPWPKTDGYGLPMQPICQINLETASLLLGENLGEGLFQLWGRVDVNETEWKRTFDGHSSLNELYAQWMFLRVIPTEHLSEAPSVDFPDASIWDNETAWSNPDGPQPSIGSFPDELRLKPVISWHKVGRMFPHYLANLQHMGEIYNQQEDDFDLLNDFFEDLPSSIPTPFSAPDVYLGGFGGQARGDEDRTLNKDLVMRLAIDMGGMTAHIGIMVERDSVGGVTFKSFARLL
jgi:hypothetical protein